METPRGLGVPAPPGTFGKFVNAAIQMDGISRLAILAIFIGWFFLDTLLVTLGSLRRGVRFFDISSAIADRTRIFFGADDSVQRILRWGCDVSAGPPSGGDS